MKRREFAKLAALGVVGAAFPGILAGCTTTAAPSPAVGKAVTPKLLTIGSAQDISTADPAVANVNQVAEGHAIRTLYDPLFRYRGNPPKLIPVLAETMDQSADGLDYTIRLKSNARFQDGSPVTAAAVKFSFQRVLQIKRGASIFWNGVIDPDAIATPDDRTVKIHLLRPYVTFPLTLPALMIVNPKVVQEHAGTDNAQSWLNNHSAGSGAFSLKEFRPGETYVFDADPNYWGGWRPEGRLSGYVWQIIREPSAAIIALKRGDIHIFTNVSPKDANGLKSEPTLTLQENPGITVHRIVLHNANPRGYTTDPEVRRALNYAFNADDVLLAYDGHAAKPQGPVPPGFPGFDSKTKTLEFDIAKAKAALAKSKWPNGGFALEYMTPAGFEPAKAIGLIMLQGLKALNIEVKIVEVPTANFVQRRAKPETQSDTMSFYLSGQYADADSYLYNQYFSGNAGAGNYSYYKNPEVDRLLLMAREIVDPQRRQQIYSSVQQTIVDENVDIITTIENSLVPISKKVRGYEFMPYDVRTPLATDLWIED